ncbi:Phosphonopyruvate hydrolase [Andreprevotia sp. IGB-42]|uniref:phosphoenolpyruvate mutase n=1 Tax=Andreprevotia sp. IGB-42 TaxID=2497473 RepID=UPI00157E4720|nr:phosphoenolpyruvate mutase [Andreprevotia sp. IGB-42]KAF0815046.1 Phosphonopyruvate hydrolase [Andreprevotia sp. IGB-42]
MNHACMDFLDKGKSTMKKVSQFKALLQSDQLEFICEAHNGLSAKIVEEAGFKGIWGSGLSISAQFGVRDNNEASWTQVLDVLEFMSDATSVPILLDGDTGYGNFNNVQRLVRKLEQRDIAAVCLEDKLFPKSNSFIGGKQQPLAPIDEFAGKIKAGKDAQRDDDFCIVARVEAFIAGWGLAEAMRRAEAYHAAGADAILIHSALAVPDEILAFKREWADRSPVVIVPTKYYSTPTDIYRAQGISMVIWANHVLRSAISGMQQVTRRIYEEQSLIRVESDIATVNEIFRLQGAGALEEAEKRYLPSAQRMPHAVVLAASRGVELGELTLDRPKAMVQVGTAPILGHIVAAYNASGIKDITVVRGYQKAAITLPNLAFVDNDDYASTGELVSLQKGLAAAGGDQHDVIVSYGDVLFRKYVPEILHETADALVIMVDTDWRDSANRNRIADYVHGSLPYSRQFYGREAFLERIAADLPEGEIHGEWMGFLKIGAEKLPLVRELLAQLLAVPENRGAKIPQLLNLLVERGERVRVVYTTGHWLDIDSLEDVTNAGAF